MSVLGHLEPKAVFAFFEQICAIPHGSFNNTQLSNWLVEFARARGLEYYQDAAENVVIIKEATPGYENAEPVIVQGHMDMVCEKEIGCTKDMLTEGLDLAVDGDTVYAKGTTLGGDDGIAVAMGLALLDAKNLCHPRLEVVFTTDEEVGMPGATALDVSMLRGRRMLNLDSEEEGIFTVSCAGGNVSHVTIPVSRAAFDGAVMTVSVSGLAGGHSGVEINKGRANADLLLGRLLYAAAQKTDLRVIRVDGGMKDNAIPTAAKAVVSVADTALLRAVCEELAADFAAEYQVTDSGICVSVSEGGEGLPMDAESTDRVICLLVCAPNGVQAMSADIEGLVQTSLNLGILKTEEIKVEAAFCIRSSVDSQKIMLQQRVACLARQLGGSTVITGDYPGWAFRQESPLRDMMCALFVEQYGYAPKIEALHAGLECGLFAGKLPGLDCVSFGPDLTDIHTPREKMHIASVQRTWKLVVELLRRMK